MNIHKRWRHRFPSALVILQLAFDAFERLGIFSFGGQRQLLHVTACDGGTTGGQNNYETGTDQLDKSHLFPFDIAKTLIKYRVYQRI